MEQLVPVCRRTVVALFSIHTYIHTYMPTMYVLFTAQNVSPQKKRGRARGATCTEWNKVSHDERVDGSGGARGVLSLQASYPSENHTDRSKEDAIVGNRRHQRPLAVLALGTESRGGIQEGGGQEVEDGT